MPFDYMPSQCRSCKHFQSDVTCPAFPLEIPRSIFVWSADHRKVVPGQTGMTTYEYDGESAMERQDWFGVFSG